MGSALLTLLAGFVVTLLLDLLWLGKLMQSFYKSQIGGFARGGPAGFQPIWWAALSTYVLIVLAISIFVLPAASTKLVVFYRGAILGLVIYGVYEFTNYSLIKDWPMPLVWVDTLWGCVLVGTTSLIMHLVAAKLVVSN